MSKSRFVFDKFAKLIEQGLLNYKDLSDEVIKEEKGIIVDLIRAAHSNAKNQLKSKTSDEISKATGAFGIPGFKWPL